MKFILDATPLIYLVKSGLYKVIEKLGMKLITTEAVLSEVLVMSFTEYSELKNFTDQNVEVYNIDPNKSFLIDGLDSGEISVLSLAKKESLPLVTDDKEARSYAIANKIEIYRTTYFIYAALRRGIISKDEALRYLDKMIAEGWYCDIQTYIKIKNKIEKSD